jgi:hypothetical protein
MLQGAKHNSEKRFLNYKMLLMSIKNHKLNGIKRNNYLRKNKQQSNSKFLICVFKWKD